MNYPKETIERLKKKLQDEKVRLQVSMDSLTGQDPFKDTERLNDNAASDTEANEETAHDRYEALEKALKQDIDEVNEALKQIETDSYGTCTSCGRTIEVGRLMVKPEAKYCLADEKKHEK